MAMKNTDDGTVRPFADFFREHGNGRTHDEMSDVLRDLIAKVKDTGRKGSLTLTITVEPMKKDDRMVIVSDSLRVRLPEHDRPTAVWYVDRSGNLTRNDPNQMTFETLREVPAPAGVDAATGEVSDEYKGA